MMSHSLVHQSTSCHVTQYICKPFPLGSSLLQIKAFHLVCIFVSATRELVIKISLLNLKMGLKGLSLCRGEVGNVSGQEVRNEWPEKL